MPQMVTTPSKGEKRQKLRVVKINQNSDSVTAFNSDVVELLGFTHEYLSANSGLELPDNVIELATQIALVSSKLNLLCQKFDKQISVAKILDVQRKQIEWAEMVSKRRAERAARERTKIVKSLRGTDRKIYEKTGELPHEYEERIKERFKEFLLMAQGSEVL